jgi:hypothetical protein
MTSTSTPINQASGVRVYGGASGVNIGNYTTWGDRGFEFDCRRDHGQTMSSPLASWSTRPTWPTAQSANTDQPTPT